MALVIPFVSTVLFCFILIGRADVVTPAPGDRVRADVEKLDRLSSNQKRWILRFFLLCSRTHVATLSLVLATSMVEIDVVLYTE